VGCVYYDEGEIGFQGCWLIYTVHGLWSGKGNDTAYCQGARLRYKNAFGIKGVVCIVAGQWLLKGTAPQVCQGGDPIHTFDLGTERGGKAAQELWGNLAICKLARCLSTVRLLCR